MRSNKCIRAQKGTGGADLTHSLKAREKVLLEIIGSDVPVSAQVAVAVQSTTNFANWEWPTKGITRLARGTARKYSIILFSNLADGDGGDGWRYLDNLRKAVKDRVQTSTSKRSVASRIVVTTRKAEEQLQKTRALEKAMLLQSRAYLSLLQQVRGLAYGKSEQPISRLRIVNILNGHDELYGSLFGPEMRDAIRPDNVEKFQRREAT